MVNDRSGFMKHRGLLSNRRAQIFPRGRSFGRQHMLSEVGLYSKRAQGMVIDLIMLVLIVTMFFIFLSSQVANKSADTGVIRSQSFYIQRLMISVLNYEVPNGTYKNLTVAELLGRYHCNDQSLGDTVNSTITQAMKELSKENYYFIFLSQTSSIDRLAVYDRYDCVKTETINIAKHSLDLPCSKTAELTLGVWPITQEVEPC